MDKAEVQKIIREELAFMLKHNKLVFPYPMQILDGNDIVIGSTVGTRIGTASTQKLSLWGVTPIIQPTAPSEPTGGSVIDVQARSVINGMRQTLIEVGIWKA